VGPNGQIEEVKAGFDRVIQHIDDKTLKEIFTQRADTFDWARQMDLAKHGENDKVILLENGSDMVPRFEGR
jgi:hypothetical protein